MQVTPLGIVDEKTSQALPSPDSKEWTMSTEVPSEIFRTKQCAAAGVVAAWSQWVLGRDGVVPDKGL